MVSAATAAAYLAGEVTLPFPAYVGALLFLVIFTIISLSGLRESARLALAVLSLHVSMRCTLWKVFYSESSQIITMLAIFLASIVAWGCQGNSQLRENWMVGRGSMSTAAMVKQVFNGICIGVLGLTGFECMVLFYHPVDLLKL